MCSPKKVNLNNAWITHQQNTQETFIEESSSGQDTDLQPTTSVKTNYLKTFLTELAKTWRTPPLQILFRWHLRQRYHFKQKLVNFTVGWENKN